MASIIWDIILISFLLEKNKFLWKLNHFKGFSTNSGAGCPGAASKLSKFQKNIFSVKYILIWALKKNQGSNPKNGFKNHKGRITAWNPPPLSIAFAKPTLSQKYILIVHIIYILFLKLCLVLMMFDKYVVASALDVVVVVILVVGKVVYIYCSCFSCSCCRWWCCW